MNDLFREYIGNFVTVYLDDILNYSRSLEDYVKHLNIVLSIFKENQLTVSVDKCELFKEELLYIGHIVSKDGVKVDPAKIEAVQHLAPPHYITFI